MVVRKTLFTLLIVFLAFYLMFFGYSFSKKPIMDEIFPLLSEITNLINTDSWDQAENKLNEIKTFWQETKPRYQINQANSQIDDFENSLNKLKVYISNQEKTEGLVQVEEAKLTWQKLNSL
ncbi:MAG: DUF4363 family protein [Bacillota bacterium]|nr:DUF4363 family protein [Bacillota bacterium]